MYCIYPKIFLALHKSITLSYFHYQTHPLSSASYRTIVAASGATLWPPLWSRAAACCRLFSSCCFSFPLQLSRRLSLRRNGRMLAAAIYHTGRTAGPRKGHFLHIDPSSSARASACSGRTLASGGRTCPPWVGGWRLACWS